MAGTKRKKGAHKILLHGGRRAACVTIPVPKNMATELSDVTGLKRFKVRQTAWSRRFIIQSYLSIGVVTRHGRNTRN